MEISCRWPGQGMAGDGLVVNPTPRIAIGIGFHLTRSAKAAFHID